MGGRLGLVAALVVSVLLASCGGGSKATTTGASQGNSVVLDDAGSATKGTTVLVPDRPAAATVGLLKPCLLSEGLRVYAGSGAKSGGAKVPIEVGATQGEGGPGAVLAVYDSNAEAARALPSVVARTKQAAEKGGSAAPEQHGSVTVLWIPNPPADSARTAVLGCLS